jgi:hypothetical protein
MEAKTIKILYIISWVLVTIGINFYFIYHKSDEYIRIFFTIIQIGILIFAVDKFNEIGG